MLGIALIGGSSVSLWNSAVTPPPPVPDYLAVPTVDTSPLTSTNVPVPPQLPATSLPATPAPNPTPAPLALPEPTQAAPIAPVTTSTTTVAEPPPPPPPEPVPTTTEAPPPPPPPEPKPQPKKESKPEPERRASCRDFGELNLLSHAEQATADIVAATGFKGTIGGRAERPKNPKSDHPHGLAIDLMTSNLNVGNEVVKYAKANADRLAIKYTLWQVKDHYDHVHISFERKPGKSFNPRCD